MTDNKIKVGTTATVCKKSYWIYIDKGGYLEVKAQLNQRVKKNDLIAVLRNPFGDLVKEYYCPEDGIVIGRSSNPVNMSGGRIIHLGILQNADQ
jgi:predicted deacylase